MENGAMSHRGFALEELEEESPVHLVGIGGAGMSAIATILLEMGYRVEGSDIKESANTRRLRGLGAVVGVGHRPENLGSAGIVVSSSAIYEDNAELVEAKRRDIPIITRAEMLAAIMSMRKGIAVAGTHGKTTTSSIVAQVLLQCGTDPSFIIGGELNEIGGNAHWGNGELLVAEADESDGSLLHLRPYSVVLTNVDGDHLDYFESLEQTARVFLEFLLLLPENGFAVVCGDDLPAREVGILYKGQGGRVLFYGRGPDNDYRFEREELRADGSGYEAFCLGEKLGQVRTKVTGLHNVYNSLAALAIGHQLGLSLERTMEGIGGFQGVRRRFETIGSINGIEVIDDYAHHPTEIKAVLDLAHRIAAGRVVVVFQPHRYSRTGLLAEEFGRSFKAADFVIVTDVYGAGEDPVPGVTGRLIIDSILENDPERRVEYVPNRAELARSVVNMIHEGDLVITMGAGDVTQCAREILELLGGDGS
jgi:UDP-N-acetylmuramate--alanine ligase